MYLVDTHTHLFVNEFQNDFAEVIEQAKSVGVTTMLLPNIDISTIEPMMNVCKLFPTNCFPMIGLHPTSVNNDYGSQLTIIEKYLSEYSFVAIGEVGIDLYWDKTFFEQQKMALVSQIELSRKYHLPIVIHCRESFDEIISVMRKCQTNIPYCGVFHSFAGTVDQAKTAIDLGFDIGINGIVTFKNSGLGDVVKQIPIEHIVLETDSPYLTPTPHRGKRNQSAYLPLVAQQIANLKQISIDELATITTANAKRIFRC
jgi:TatD DNase family protein